MELFIHRSPAVASAENIQPISAINSPDFDFNEHFEKEAFAKLGRWWICFKAKPWTTKDLMIIDSGKIFYRTLRELNLDELKDLTQIIWQSIEELRRDQKVKFVVVGANINPFPELADSESIARLHLHVCGFLQDEIDKFEKSGSGELQAFEDKIIGEFSQEDISEGFEKYQFGICRKINNLDQENLRRILENLDSEPLEILNKIKAKGKYPILSYSFALKIENNNATLYISPKSKNGRGVLESFGIKLERDNNMIADQKFTKIRNGFLRKIKEDILEDYEARAGSLKLEAM